jgi:hypothetical protein
MRTRRILSVALNLVGCLAFLGVSIWSPQTHACSIMPHPNEFVLDRAPATEPPDPPALTLVSVELQRSEHAPPGTGDCKDVGSLTIKLAPADGTTWPANVGVSLALVRGTMPGAFPIPTHGMQTSDGSLIFAGGDDPSQAIGFTVQATAVNRVGTQSAPIEIHIVGGARGSSGCTVAGGHRHSRAVPVMLALWALAFARLRRAR